MIWNQIQGVEEPLQLLHQAAKRNRLSHSYLLAGPAGIGKRRFATLLAQCLLCEQIPAEQLDACGRCSSCRMMQAETHPDFLKVMLPEGKRELPIDLIIGPADQRGRTGLCYELSLKPMAGHRKVAVIDDADLMNQESANALLKTLEEPPPQSYLFLIATRTDAMLPTIRSRCQQIRFRLLPDEIVAQLILEQQLASNATEASEMAHLASGSMQAALQLADPELRHLKEVVYSNIVVEPFNSLVTSQMVQQAIEAIAKSGPQQRQAAVWSMRYLAQLFHQVTRQLVSDEEAGASEEAKLFINHKGLSLSDVELPIQLFARSMEAEQQLERFMPVALCLDGLFDELGRIMRSQNTLTAR